MDYGNELVAIERARWRLLNDVGGGDNLVELTQREVLQLENGKCRQEFWDCGCVCDYWGECLRHEQISPGQLVRQIHRS